MGRGVTSDSTPLRRVALVTHGFEVGGGVPSVARWLRAALQASGNYLVDVHDLATSSRDRSSRRIIAPRSWSRRSLLCRSSTDPGVFHWGANAVEVEIMRYRPRRELGAALQAYDVIQVVAGGAAWASAVTDIGVPVVLQVATLAAWERPAQLADQAWPIRAVRSAMTGLTTRAEDVALRDVDTVLVENSVMLEHVRSIGQARVVMARPGVDSDRFSPPSRGWQRDGYLLSVCRLGEPRKGLHRMIRAYAEMVRLRPSSPRLVLAGRGQLTEPCRQLIAELDLTGRVSVRPDIEPPDLVDLYRGAAVYLQTSYQEGLGLSALEAMSCGVPVVSTDTDGSREFVVNGETGWLVPQASGANLPTVVAERTLSIIAGDGASFSSRCREVVVAEFSTDISLRRFTAVYDELLGASMADCGAVVEKAGQQSPLRVGCGVEGLPGHGAEPP